MSAAIKGNASYLHDVNAKQNAGIDKFNRMINNPTSNAALREILTAHIQETVRDPATAAALTPNYPVGCKRTCIIDDYWPTYE